KLIREVLHSPAADWSMMPPHLNRIIAGSPLDGRVQQRAGIRGGPTMDGLLRALIKTVRRRVRADEELTVEAVTKELGYTRQYVSGRFHRITGRLLSHFLKEKRLEKAARLLKSGNMRISQIARRCGFDSENYFRQQFRERFGMSPRQFRTNGRLRWIRRPQIA